MWSSEEFIYGRRMHFIEGMGPRQTRTLRWLIHLYIVGLITVQMRKVRGPAPLVHLRKNRRVGLEVRSQSVKKLREVVYSVHYLSLFCLLSAFDIFCRQIRTHAEQLRTRLTAALPFSAGILKNEC